MNSWIPFVTMQNIRDSEDVFERYKMPQPIIRFKYQGKYNQTYISNITKISKSLHINPMVVVKYFGSHLNTQSKLINDCELSLRGNFRSDILKNSLKNFIEKFILCKKCNLPELEFKVKRKNLQMRCKACGYIKFANTQEKIYKAIYIIESAKVKSSKVKKQKEKDQDEFQNESDTNVLDTNKEEWSADFSEEAIQKRKEIFSESVLLGDLFQI